MQINYSKSLVQSRCQYKELRINLNFQKQIIVIHSSSTEQYLQHFWPQGLKLLTRLRLGFIGLKEHRFNYNFQKCMNPVCSCSLEIEDTSHYLLHCHHYTLHRVDLMNSVKSICNNFESMTDNNKIMLLLYGDFRFDENKNKFILQSTYIKTTERFSWSLFE